MPRPFRAVLDTNVLISGLCFGRPPGQVLRLAVAGRFEPVTSAVLIEEFRRVMAEKFPERESAVADTLAELALLWEVVPARAMRRLAIIRADPPDDRVLECAVAGKADAIVSGDRHLLDLAEYRGIPILPPSRFLEKFAR